MTLEQLASRTDAFTATWVNHKVTTDGAFPRDNWYQCWDLADRFAKDVVGCPILNTRIGGNGTASDCYRQFIDPLPRYFVRLAYGSTPPMKGDLIVWDETQGGGAGHIAVYLYATTKGFLSLDQNWTPHAPPSITQHNWTHILGILRPILTTEGEPMIADTDQEYSRWSKLFYQVRGREGTRQEFRNAAVGRTWLSAIEILSDDTEASITQHAQDVGFTAIREKWDQQLAALHTQIEQLNKQASELANKPTLTALTQLQDGLESAETSTNSIAAATAKVQSDQTTLPTKAKPSLLTKLLATFIKPKKK